MHLFFQICFLCNFSHHLFSQNTSNLSSRCQQVSTRRECRFWNQLCNTTANPNNSVHPIYLQQIYTVYWSGLTIGIGSLQENPTYRKISERLLGRAGVGRCPGSSNRCKVWLANKQAGKYISATKLELNMFRPFTLGEIVWHLSTQVNGSDIDAYITVFEPRRDNSRSFIHFLVYDRVYPSIASNLVTLATLSPWYKSVCTYTCSPFLRKHLLRWHKTVETGILI